MKINHNISAVITNNQLLRTENTLAESMERLSSGLRINHASDDPSGMAIGAKMQAQIDGLSQASRNAADGSSVLQTADGALTEVTNMIQRMRELAVQAANGTNSMAEKEACQQEIASLREEINRISQDTEFNTKTLLDGSLDTRVYADNVTRIQASDSVPAGTYKLTVDTAATQATQASGVTIADDFKVTKEMAGAVDINGYEVKLTEGMTGKDVYAALRDGAEKAEATISDYGDALVFTSKGYGSGESMTVTAGNEALANALGLPREAPNPVNVGKDAKVTLDKNSDWGKQATVLLEGNKCTVTDIEGFSLSMKLDDGFDKANDVAHGTGEISLEVTDIGTMKLQIGANKNQNMEVKIPEISCNSLYIDDLDVTTVNGANKAMDQLDDALEQISSIRSKIGAFENRLDYSVASLDQTNENMTAAISRIEDVDMAEEMTTYTQYNVLAQAATSALSQANELPQMALQLLQ